MIECGAIIFWKRVGCSAECALCNTALYYKWMVVMAMYLG
jgi:hypothetical protein